MINAVKGRWIYVVIGMMTTMVAIAFARMSYGVILPYMSDTLSLSYKQSGLLGTLTSLGYLSFVLVAGIIAAKWGSKKTIISGLSCITISFLALSFTPNYISSTFLMLLLGTGTAFTFTNLIALVTAWFPSKRGLVLGLISSGVGIGVLITGILVPFLGELYPEGGWRISWGLFAVMGLATLLMAFIFLKDHPSAKKTIDRKATSRTVVWQLYKNQNIVLVGIIYAIVGCIHLVQAIFIVSFMMESEIPATIAGQLVALNGIISIFCGPVWGYVSDRIGRVNAIIITISLTFIANILVVFSQSLSVFTIHMLLLSATLSGLLALVQAASIDQVNKPEYMPIVFSYVTFYFAAGQLIGPILAGWFIEDLGGFKSAFSMVSLMLAIGIILAIRLKVNSKAKVVPQAVNQSAFKTLTK